MPLTREQKTVFVDEIASMIEEAPYIYFTDFQGLTVAQTNELRSRFRESGVGYKVLKNTLIRLALERLGGYDELIEHLHGPTAIALSEEPAAPARVIKNFLADEGIERPELKVAYVDGDLYEGGALDALAALKSKDELIGDIIALLQAPTANIVGGLQAQGSNLAGAIQAIAEREA